MQIEIQTNIVSSSCLLTFSDMENRCEIKKMLYSRWRQNKGRKSKQTHMKENLINRLKIRCSRQIMKGKIK